MINKQKKYILIFAIIFLSFSANFCSALEITDYPAVPGLPTITDNSTMGEYIGYFFGLTIMLAGALALISLAVGAVQLIMSAGNPEVQGNAKDRIKGSILGLVLLMVSFIIMRTINPVLIAPALTALPGVEGIFYFNGSDEKPSPEQEADTSAILKAGFTQIFYKCSASGETLVGPDLIIWKYPEKNFGVAQMDIGGGTKENNYNSVVVEKISCDSQADISGAASFKMAFETPGVYYFLDDGCKGFMSNAVISSEQEISEPFKGRIKSVRVLNNPEQGVYYGLVLHKNPSFTGTCTVPLVAANKKEDCYKNLGKGSPEELMKTQDSYFSADIFRWNKDHLSSGNGVVFYGRPFGWATGSKAGYYVLTRDKLGQIYWQEEPKNMNLDYTGIEVTQEEKNARKTFADSPGSIEIRGNYMVVMHTENDFCQVFNKNVPNLNEEQITTEGSEGSKLKMVEVVPVK